MVFDVETRRSAAEVGGWNRADRMGVSIAVAYDSKADDYFAYQQEELPALFEKLRVADLVVGFNSLRFDYAVLSPFAPFDRVRPVSRNTASFFILVPLFLINRRMRETEIHTQDIRLPAQKSVKRLCVTQL